MSSCRGSGTDTPSDKARERLLDAVVDYARWWPGRTDEVRRVADRLRALGQPDGATTIGEMAGKTGSGVAIVSDALDMNECVASVLEDLGVEYE